MVATNTPPSSPFDNLVEDDGEADELELFEEDIDEFVSEEMEGQEAGVMGEDDDEQDIEGAGSLEPIQDDSVLTFDKHTGSVFCCNLNSGEGTFAVSGGEDDVAYVWDYLTGNIEFTCTGHKDSVICGEFSRDGTYLATGDMSGVIQVWKMSTKTVIWETAIDDLTWLRWHQRTNILLGASVAGDVYMWKIPSGECKMLAGHGEKTDVGIILPDGKRAAVGYADGSIKVFDLKACAVLHHVLSDADAGLIASMDAHSDNNLLIACGSGGRVVLVTTQTGKLASTLDCSPPPGLAAAETANQFVEAVGFCHDPHLQLAAAGTLEGYLVIWDTARLIQRHILKQDAGIVRLLWDKMEPVLYTAGLDGIIRKYDGRSGTLISQWSGFRGEVLDISLSGDGKTLLAGSDDSTARIFSVSSVS